MVVNLTSVRLHSRATADADLDQCPGSSIIQPIYICPLFTLPISRFPDFSDHLVMTLYYLYVYYASAMQNLCYYFYCAANIFAIGETCCTTSRPAYSPEMTDVITPPSSRPRAMVSKLRRHCDIILKRNYTQNSISAMPPVTLKNNGCYRAPHQIR